MRQITLLTKLCFTIVTIIYLTACTVNKVKQALVLDEKKLGSIDLVIDYTESTGLTPGAVAALKQQVSQNLAEWQYPIGLNTKQLISHVLTATIKPVVHSSPPTGFSFSAGNSDPRALDFQKMDVLPIICQISAITQPLQVSELSMGFTANQHDKWPLAPEKLADHISTVCFNLLREIHWPIEANNKKPELVKSGWFPEVQIENKAIPNDDKSKASSSDEVKTEPDEPRQEIIIHNQGSPVILHFGHERR